MSETFTTADVLDAAADHIATYGHAKSEGGDMELPCCAMGAIEAASKSLDSDDFERVVSVFKRHIGWGGDSDDPLFAWNDHPSRTASEVISALRECAAGLREGEGQP